jgi:hypothetical protein
MDNVQKANNYTNVPLSRAFRFYLIQFFIYLRVYSAAQRPIMKQTDVRWKHESYRNKQESEVEHWQRQRSRTRSPALPRERDPRAGLDDWRTEIS